MEQVVNIVFIFSLLSILLYNKINPVYKFDHEYKAITKNMRFNNIGIENDEAYEFSINRRFLQDEATDVITEIIKNKKYK